MCNKVTNLICLCIQIGYTVICGIGSCSVSNPAEPFVTVLYVEIYRNVHVFRKRVRTASGPPGYLKLKNQNASKFHEPRKQRNFENYRNASYMLVLCHFF